MESTFDECKRKAEKTAKLNEKLEAKNAELEEEIQVLNKQIFLNNNMGLNPFQKISTLEESIKERDFSIKKLEGELGVVGSQKAECETQIR
jgi:chromosome segregation ATPase